MLSLSIGEAVRARLEGRPKDYVAPIPYLNDFLSGQQGRISPSRVAEVEAEILRTTNFNTEALGGITVPIHPFDPQGTRSARIYPSITFNIGIATPRYDEAVSQTKKYSADFYESVVADDYIEITDGEETFRVPQLLKRRPVEHPYDVVVEIRIYSKDYGLKQYLQNYVYERFEPRSFLVVAMADGSSRSWDMLWKDTQDLDKRDAALSGLIDREFASSFTYNVEAYADETAKTRYDIPTRNVVQSQEKK